MTTAEKIYEAVRDLPETEARAVLDFVGALKAKQQVSQASKRQAALEQLARYRGRFKAGQFSRDELYDRASLR